MSRLFSEGLCAGPFDDFVKGHTSLHMGPNWGDCDVFEEIFVRDVSELCCVCRSFFWYKCFGPPYMSRLYRLRQRQV